MNGSVDEWCKYNWRGVSWRDTVLHVFVAHRRNNDPEAHDMNDSEYVVHLFPEDGQRKHEDNIHAG